MQLDDEWLYQAYKTCGSVLDRKSYMVSHYFAVEQNKVILRHPNNQICLRALLFFVFKGEKNRGEKTGDNITHRIMFIIQTYIFFSYLEQHHFLLNTKFINSCKMIVVYLLLPCVISASHTYCLDCITNKKS